MKLPSALSMISTPSAHAGPPIKDRAKLVAPFALLAAAYTQLAHLPLEQVLNGAIAAVLFNIIYDTLLSRRLRWFAMCPVIDSMNHQSTCQVSLPYSASACQVSQPQHASRCTQS